jgi:hypothetical protein
MLLCQARVVGVGPFDALTFPFADEMGAPRKTVVLHGGAGVGKTSLLASIASTRPGHAVTHARRGGGEPPVVVTDWLLGEDDPMRPHALRVTSPQAVLDDREDVAMMRRREQAHFDRKATEGGFALVAISGRRWFSRGPVVMSAPDRTITRYDVRAAASFDDATRADLARDTKQTLAYGAVAAALVRQAPFDCVQNARSSAETLDRALREAVAPLAKLAGYTYLGAEPMTLEPTFERHGSGALVAFDDLPTSARHLLSLAVLATRTLFAAYPGRDPRRAEGVALVDDVDLHQDASVQRALVPALRESLPGVQWILTTSSPAVTLGCAPSEVLALRRMPPSQQVELHEGQLALVH